MKRSILDIKAEKADLKEQLRALFELGKSEKRELKDDEKEKAEELKAEIEKKNEEIKALEEELEKDEDKEPVEDKKEEDKNKKEERYMKNFSIANVIRAKVNNTPLAEETRSTIENLKKEMRSNGLDVNGIAIPFELREQDNLKGPISGNELNATISDTQGKSTIHTDYQNILAPVFNADVLGEFDTLTGLVGNVEIPRYGGVGAAWKGELKKADETTMIFNGIEAKPKRLTSTIVLSKQLLMQSDYNVEQFVRQEIVRAITRKLQKTILGNQEGTENMPQGLFYNAESASAFDFAKLVDIEKEAEENNVTNNLGYVINPAIKATLRTTLKAQAAGAQFLFDNGEVLGQHTVVTNDAAGLLYGDLKQVVICSWGNGIDMVVDPYTLADYDAIKITVNSYWDVVNRAPLTGEGTEATAVKNIAAYVLS